MSTFDLPRSVDEDVQAWPITPPLYRWLFNKLEVAIVQGLHAAPHGVPVPFFPVISRPIYNLWGMGLGVEIWDSPADEKYVPGHFWCEMVTRDIKNVAHISWDLQLERIVGKQLIWRAWGAIGEQGEHPGEFKCWTIKETTGIPNHVSEFIERHLSDYVGWVNLECIGTTIIEVHFRACASFMPYYQDCKKTPVFCLPLFGGDARLAATLASAYGVDFEDLSLEDTNPHREAAGWKPRTGLFFGRDLKVLETVKMATRWGINPASLG